MRPANIEVIPDHSFKPHPTRLRSIEHTRVGDFHVPEGQVVDVASLQILLGQWRRQTAQPPPEEALGCTWTQPVADLLQSQRIVTATEAVIKLFIANSSFFQLLLRPLVPVKPEPYRIGSVRVGFPESLSPLRIPNVEVEVVYIGHLPPPLHVRMRDLILAFCFPRSPHPRLFLRDPDEDDSILLTFSRSRFEIGASQLFLVLPLLETNHRYVVGFGEVADPLYILLTDLAKRG